MTPRPIKPAPWSSRPKPIAKPGSTIDPTLRRLVAAREGGRCACCDQPLPHVWECHHRKLRSRGGQDSASNLLALCGECHRRLHNRPAYAQQHGFIVASHQDPATTPVALHLTRWVHLRPDGTYREAQP